MRDLSFGRHWCAGGEYNDIHDLHFVWPTEYVLYIATLKKHYNKCTWGSWHLWYRLIDCLFNRLGRLTSKKKQIIKLRVTGECFHLITYSTYFFYLHFQTSTGQSDMISHSSFYGPRDQRCHRCSWNPTTGLPCQLDVLKTEYLFDNEIRKLPEFVLYQLLPFLDLHFCKNNLDG